MENMKDLLQRLQNQLGGFGALGILPSGGEGGGGLGFLLKNPQILAALNLDGKSRNPLKTS